MAAGMKAFFKNELISLKAKTGLNQFENMKLDPNWKEVANKLCDQLAAETIKPPFDRIKVEVIQRVLVDAMMNDKDFIGWNPRWVRIALNTWWSIYGGKLMEAMAKDPDKKPEPYTGPPIDVDVLIDSYVRRLKEAPMMKRVPYVSPEEAKEEGQARPKAHVYRSTDRSYLNEVNARVRKGRELYFRENYPGATEEQVQQYLDSFEK